MARDLKRMALYEAIKKGQSKSHGGRKIVFFRPFTGRSRFGRKRRIEASTGRRLIGGTSYARRRPLGLFKGRRAVLLRVLGIAAIAAVVVFGLVRLVDHGTGRKGLFSAAKEPVELPGGGQDEQTRSVFPQPAVPRAITPLPEAPANGSIPRAVEPRPIEPAVVPATRGTNVIVIQTFTRRRDLEPVQEHFAANGVETEIEERGNYFFLRTKELYQRCSVDNTAFNPKYDGDVARKKIQEVGAKYKAPAGYENFRPNLFQDAYAQKVR